MAVLEKERPSLGWIAAPSALMGVGLIAELAGWILNTQCRGELFTFSGSTATCESLPLNPVTSTLFVGGLVSIVSGAVGLIALLVVRSIENYPELKAATQKREVLFHEDYDLAAYQRRNDAKETIAPLPPSEPAEDLR